MSTLFELYTEKQREQIRNWKDEHDKECPYYMNSGAIGGRTTYSFTPTGIGVVETVHCACGAKLDVTEYEDW